MKDFKDELTKIEKFLNSSDYELRILGYNLLRESDFKKFMRNRVWSTNNMSFYRFNLYQLNLKKYSDGEYQQHVVDYHNCNKMGYAWRVVKLYLDGKLIIKKPNWKV